MALGIIRTGDFMTERRRSVLLDEDIERIGASTKKALTEHDALLGINSSSFEGAKRFRDTIQWAEGAMDNTQLAKRWVWAGVAAVFVAAVKGLWTMYEGVAAFIAIHAK